MNRQEALDQLVSWLREISTDFSLEESSLNSTTVFVAKMYTDNNRYSIVCRLDEDGAPFYLGCQATSRKERPGEEWKRGNDLPDGPFSEKTWKTIVNAILKYETQELQAKPPMDKSRAIMSQIDTDTELRDDDALFLGKYNIVSIAEGVVYDTIGKNPGASSRRIFKEILSPKEIDMKQIPVITRSRFKKLIEDGVAKGHLRARGHRKYKLYPVQEWLVSMPLAKDSWWMDAPTLYLGDDAKGKRGPFKIFHFDTGRRSGKSLMAREMILRQVEMLSSQLAAGELVRGPSISKAMEGDTVVGIVIDGRPSITNIIHILPNRRLRDDAQKAMLKDLHDCGFDPQSRGEAIVVGSVHIHYVAATDREWYAGRRFENPALVCIEDAGDFDPNGLMIATDPPPTRIVILGDTPEGQLLHLLGRPDAISMKFPAPSVNQLLLPSL